MSQEKYSSPESISTYLAGCTIDVSKLCVIVSKIQDIKFVTCGIGVLTYPYKSKDGVVNERGLELAAQLGCPSIALSKPCPYFAIDEVQESS